MLYDNLSVDFEIIRAKDRVYGKDFLKSEFARFLREANFLIEKWVKTNRVPYELIIRNDLGDRIFLSLFLKNITGAGWADKPHIKRAQVSNVRIVAPDSLYETTDYQTLLIIGYYNFDNNPIMAGWDAYQYLNHNTVRSCYVDIATLLKGYESGYYHGTYASQQIWVFDVHNFERFIKDYIDKQK